MLNFNSISILSLERFTSEVVRTSLRTTARKVTVRIRMMMMINMKMMMTMMLTSIIILSGPVCGR